MCEVCVIYALYTGSQPTPLMKRFQIPDEGQTAQPCQECLLAEREEGDCKFYASDIISSSVPAVHAATFLFCLCRCHFFFLFGGFISFLSLLSKKTDCPVSSVTQASISQCGSEAGSCLWFEKQLWKSRTLHVHVCVSVYLFLLKNLPREQTPGMWYDCIAS